MSVIKKIEEIVGVKLEKEKYGDLYDPNQKNTYSMRKDHIDSLRLDDVTVNDFSDLLPYLEKVSHFNIHNSTIQNFSDLLKLNCYYLYIDNITFKNNICDTIGKLPGHLTIINTKFDATCLRYFKKTNFIGFHQVELKNCHIDNIQELNSLEPISLLILDKITFNYHSKKTIKKSTKRISLHNMIFEDLSFLPFKESLENIEFENCQIGSISQFNKFSNLKEVQIDSDTTIEDKFIHENTSNKKIDFILKQGKQPLNLREIISIKKYVHQLQLNDYKKNTLDYIEEFKQVKRLSFYKSTVYLNAFLPIANQIKSIYFEESKILNYSAFKYFKNLIKLQSKCYEEDNNGIRNFKKLLPLKNQLKVLDICEFQEIKEPHFIEELTTLQSFKIEYEVPVQTAKHILNLNNLTKLSLSVEDTEHALNLKQLNSIEFLMIKTKVNCIGFEYLKNLKSLKIGNQIESPAIDINTFPKMESLERLNIVSYNREVKGLEQFPNLEALKIKGSPKIRLTTLKKLKILDLENCSFEDFSKFEELPNLEKLDLSSLCSEINLKGFYKFKNLKYLTFLESKLNDITHLEPLKKLQYLDLFSTEISDIKVLNTLPNLKGVNISTWSHLKYFDLEEQLENKNIIIECALPFRYFNIWEEDEFGI